ncbi:VOC family protein [Marinicella sp. S1101]|uniref:VOC family protein n=1 Tax=Marinicella marina TaxID=2996016 RepID=UPI0022609DE2|nr:VOC family protein [Marinicella marina]MCX7552277.1 VOC family protein [Marinicella marina]MDJ1139153.1 VOC family protein [Marinicella marina]
MVRLEHVNLVGKNIEKSLAFYQAAFPHWKIRAEGGGQWYGKSRRWVHFGDDYQYLAISDFGEGENRDLSGHSVGLAHIAFAVDNLEALIHRLVAAGYAVHKPGADADFRKNIYFLDADGFEVEFTEYASDLPDQRNA